MKFKSVNQEGPLDPPLRLGSFILSDVNSVTKPRRTKKNLRVFPNPSHIKKLPTIGMEPKFMDGGTGDGDNVMSDGGDGVFMVNN